MMLSLGMRLRPRMSLGMMLSLGMRLRLKNKAEPGNEATA